MSFRPILVLGLLGTGCGEECQTTWLEPEPVLWSIGADLHDVITIDDGFDDQGRAYSYLAVGASGTVVAWGSWYEPSTEEFEFITHDFDLHAVAARANNWWVVGDDGMIAVSADLGRTWTRIDLGITADLRAITDAGFGLVVVGDGVILVQAPDRTWTEANAPVDGWGHLRAVHHDGIRVHAVGLGGVIWSTTDPHEGWKAVDVGVDADLFAIGALSTHEPEFTVVVGADGTFLSRGPDSGWNTRDLGIDEDLIAYSRGAMLGADGTVYFVERSTVTTVDHVAGARSLDYDFHGYFGQGKMGIVGDHGSARTLTLDYCLYP